MEIAEHPLLGKGKILNARWRDQELLVQFDGGLEIWVPKSTIKVQSSHQRGIASNLRIGRKRLPRSTPRKTYKGNITERRMIEAFKLGIVPHEQVKDFTFGREKEIEKLERGFERLEKESGSVLTIEGEYGSGKTHFLDYIYFTALEKNYAVAKTALDPIDVTPYDPKSIYRELVESFKFKGGGFREFLKESAKVDNLEGHRFLNPILQQLRDGDIEEDLWKWIEAEHQPRWYLNKFKELRKLPLLPNFSTAADNYCYLLSGIATLSKKLGLKGFVILIDEAETLFHTWWRTVSLDRGVNFFKGLALTALGEIPTTLTSQQIRKDEWLNAYVEDTGNHILIHRGVRTCMTPYLYKNPSNIFLVLAFTPTVLSAYQNILDTIGDKGIHTYLLKLNLSDFKEIFERLIEIYTSAFPETEIKKYEKDYIFHKVKNFTTQGVRAFIKASIEAFDLHRYYPEESPDSLLQE